MLPSLHAAAGEALRPIVLDAKIAGEVMGRSIAEQIEYWARLGMILERILTGGQQAALIQKASTEELLERL